VHYNEESLHFYADNNRILNKKIFFQLLTSQLENVDKYFLQCLYLLYVSHFHRYQFFERGWRHSNTSSPSEDDEDIFWNSVSAKYFPILEGVGGLLRCERPLTILSKRILDKIRTPPLLIFRNNAKVHMHIFKTAIINACIYRDRDPEIKILNFVLFCHKITKSPL
jgi:hypothetical protein